MFYCHHHFQAHTFYLIPSIGPIISARVESWSHLFTHLTHWPTEQSICDPHMTHLWFTWWSFLFKSNLAWPEKFLRWKNAMDFFILGRIQNRSLAQRWNLWMPHASEQLGIISWFNSHQWYFSAFIRPKVRAHLPDASTVF